MNNTSTAQIPSNTYDDGNIPEIDLPKSDNASNTFPLEFGNDNSLPKNEPTYPTRNEPGRE